MKDLSTALKARGLNMMGNSNCPCKDCVPPKRHPACHGSCPDFYDFNENRLGIKRAKRHVKNQEAMVDSYVIAQTAKSQRKKNTEHAHKRK